MCHDCEHIAAINRYADVISKACLDAGENSIPHTTDRCAGKRIPGWSERVEPLRQKSLFWHGIWIDCGRPRGGAVADCMRRTRAAYHYAIRKTKREEDNIVRERIAEALITDPTRNFWHEIKKIHNNKAQLSRIVDGCSDEDGIARIFASKYKTLYTSVPYDKEALCNILTDIEADISQSALATDFLIHPSDVMAAISKLNLHKSDGNSSLSSDHFVYAGRDLSVHISFLFSAIICHGSVPRDFVTSTIIPIPKKRNGNLSDSDNFRGIALSSVFGKIFDNLILSKYRDKLCTSDLQFGFKQKSSTSMCSMVLKETISYYVSNHSNVFCTFLDASKAFDRVNYIKLFNLLIKRGLPACIIRALINMYTGHLIRISWAGVVSDYFAALNGVKQGGVVSPVLFCIYMDDLLLSLSRSGVGCYIGLSFVGAIAYADDIVLISPTPFAMRKLLSICDSFALEFDILFNAAKSKFLVILANKWRSLCTSMNECNFNIGGNPIENVTSYPHLGHVINSSFNDNDDIKHRRQQFIGQSNNVFCFFAKLDLCVKIKLFKAFCSSIYGCELWNLDSVIVQDFCSTWRMAVRRLLGLPYNTHCYLLPLLINSLPVFDEICKRSASFIVSCLFSHSSLVRSVAWTGVLNGKYTSVLGKNCFLCCKRFGWSVDEFTLDRLKWRNDNFMAFCDVDIDCNQRLTANLLFELICLREGYFCFDSFNNFLSTAEINLLISDVASN
jgi:hypothetical protein